MKKRKKMKPVTACPERMRKCLEAIRDYIPMPEVCYDQFAYERMVASFKATASLALRSPITNTKRRSKKP